MDVPTSDVKRDVVDDAFDALCALGHNETDARRLLDSAIARKKKFKDVNDLLTTIYDESHGRN
jgi:Holliday junction DNA helicase RuvA